MGATAGFLEFTGQGLSTFERAMDRCEKLMATLGARLLEGQKRQSESADALSIRQGGEESILAGLADSVSQSLTRVLRWVHFWASATVGNVEDLSSDEVVVELNSDFESAQMSPTEIESLVHAWQAGAISRDTMLDSFRSGELLPAGRTNEEEARLIKSEWPVFVPQGDFAAAAGPVLSNVEE